MSEGGDRLVVTGATGFIGRRLVTIAVQEGWRVTALARDPARVPRSGGVEVLEWTLDDAPALAQLAGGAVICHLAALVPRRYGDPAQAPELIRHNALATLELVRASSEAGARHFILTSSGNAYSPRESPAAEDAALFPAARAPYYLGSKLLAEIFVEHERLAGRLPCTVLRLSSVYGPGMRRQDLVADFAQRLARGETIALRNAGRTSADRVYVDDVVGALLAAARVRPSGIFNIGSGQASTTRQVAEILVELLAADPGQVRLEPEDPGAPPGFASLDIARAREVLGYAPRGLRAGLEDFVAPRGIAAAQETA